MKDYIKLFSFFTVLGLTAYVGHQNLTNTLYMLGGVCLGSTAFLWLARNGWLEFKGKEVRK